MSNGWKKPMKGDNVDMTKIQAHFDKGESLMVSRKIDGMRCIIKGGVCYSASMKRLPNEFIQERFGIPDLEGLDGELAMGPETASDVRRKTVSAVESHGGKPDITFLVFDWTDFNPLAVQTLNYMSRYSKALGMIQDYHLIHSGGCGERWMEQRLILLDQYRVYSMDELKGRAEQFLAEGYEGLMIRHPEGLYKPYHRATASQMWLNKMKPFADSEARILGCYEKFTNQNEAVINEAGYQSRSSSKEGKVAAGVLGGFEVEDIHHGWKFRIGGGFTDSQRETYWRDREGIFGLVVTYKYMEYGMKDVPSQPVFLQFRTPLDLDVETDNDI